MKFDFRDIKCCLEDNNVYGKPRKVWQEQKAEIATAIRAIEQLTESLLGTALVVRDKVFYIRMLEIYYGGIADPVHDWYRNRYVYKTSKFREQTDVQNERGFKVYLSNSDVQDTYTRMDLVVGEKGVPASLLLRSVWDENFQLVGEKRGSPNKILGVMGIEGDDHGEEISADALSGKFRLLDTHDEIYKDRRLVTVQRLRHNVKDPFEKQRNLRWQFCAEEKA